MTKLTNEQIAAFTAFGLIIADQPESLLDTMSRQEVRKLAEEVHAYLSPFIEDGDDMVTPIVAILREAVEQAKKEEQL